MRTSTKGLKYKMRNESNFVHMLNHSNVALEADFQCDCGNDTFRIYHTGKQHKSILGNVSIKKRAGQLIIQCNCSKCLKQYTLFDSTKDGIRPKGTSTEEFSSIEINGETLFKINLKYNFSEENFKTDRFEMFFMEVNALNDEKYLRICEE